MADMGHVHIQSWTKVLAPQELFQKMHNFSQKSVAITNVLVYTCLVPLSALGQHKKRRGKEANLTSFYTKLQKSTGQNHLLNIYCMLV